jgi:hypothetical protein
LGARGEVKNGTLLPAACRLLEVGFSKQVSLPGRAGSFIPGNVLLYVIACLAQKVFFMSGCKFLFTDMKLQTEVKNSYLGKIESEKPTSGTHCLK